jgi:hypothetical protein
VNWIWIVLFILFGPSALVAIVFTFYLSLQAGRRFWTSRRRSS